MIPNHGRDEGGDVEQKEVFAHGKGDNIKRAIDEKCTCRNTLLHQPT